MCFYFSFSWVNDNGGQVYSYNPCHEFYDGSSFCNEGNIAVSIYVCEVVNCIRVLS